MNKVILLGRAVKDSETRYSNDMAISRYTLAVNRRGGKEADFIDCVAFGKSGEFAEKYIKKGGQFAVVGRLQKRTWEDQNGQKRYATEVVVDEHYFAGNKAESGDSGVQKAMEMFPGATVVDDDESELPF